MKDPKLESVMQRVLPLLNDQPQKSALLGQKLKVNQLMIRAALLQLEVEGKVHRKGSTRGTRWFAGGAPSTEEHLSPGKPAEKSKPAKTGKSDKTSKPDKAFTPREEVEEVWVVRISPPLPPDPDAASIIRTLGLREESHYYVVASGLLKASEVAVRKWGSRVQTVTRLGVAIR